ncbi:TonB-dependent receptor plug domain-containing protein, partial [Pseudomonas proteolytica]|uniref:TonB-dependent receptor plug domain-containing protein n=1 Tax=Pseudomonas proteolytica TaxID=219574 RepID=UPI0030DA77A2
MAIAIAAPAEAQTTPAAPPPPATLPADTADTADNTAKDIVVTGSRIKQNPNDSALPLQVITVKELQRNSISSPEQLIAFLTDNGSSADNLASNSDVVTSERRGNNGASFANLRGQGSAATLVLLNGRRVAAQGTTGSAVDVNQIPFAALDRVEVLKDGASSSYGADAIGGVVNIIMKKHFTGIDGNVEGGVTEKGDGARYRANLTAGYGDYQ